MPYCYAQAKAITPEQNKDSKMKTTQELEAQVAALRAALQDCADDLHMAAHIIRTGGNTAQKQMVLEADEKTSWPTARKVLAETENA